MDGGDWTGFLHAASDLITNLKEEGAKLSAKVDQYKKESKKNKKRVWVCSSFKGYDNYST